MKLIYVYDPMCSWCYGFRPTWQAIRAGLPEGISVETRLGGLAPDDDKPMNSLLRDKLAGTWKRIEKQCGVPFDHSYWNQEPNPPRTTYIAGRAVRAAEQMGVGEWQMVNAIQDAYYTQARNVWKADVLAQIAAEMGVDAEAFTTLLGSDELHASHDDEVNATYQMGVQGYPSLVFDDGEQLGLLPLDYGNPDYTLEVLRALSTSPQT